jgi:hypothetical protein
VRVAAPRVNTLSPISAAMLAQRLDGNDPARARAAEAAYKSGYRQQLVAVLTLLDPRAILLRRKISTTHQTGKEIFCSDYGA